MKIISKYKKTFILVVIISLIISLLPTLGLFLYGHVTGSKVVGTVESIIDVSEVTTEEGTLTEDYFTEGTELELEYHLFRDNGKITFEVLDGLGENIPLEETKDGYRLTIEESGNYKVNYSISDFVGSITLRQTYESVKN